MSNIPPRERTVIRAIIKALSEPNSAVARDMDAFALSYDVKPFYPDQTKSKRAAMLLEAILR